MNNRILLFEELEKKVIPRLRAHGLKMQQSKGWTDSYTQERFLKVL